MRNVTAGCYADYVKQISALTEQLSPKTSSLATSTAHRAPRQASDSGSLLLPMLNSIGGVELFIGEGSGQYGVPMSDVFAWSLRGVMLATYLRVNHWADFDESYSDGKLSAAATPSNNAGRAITRCADWSRAEESRIVLSVNNSDGQ